PEAIVVDFPPLLDFPPPRLRAYPRETVVAEKLEAMVQLGIANSRMKDFFDLSFLARNFEFDGELLTKPSRQHSLGAARRSRLTSRSRSPTPCRRRAEEGTVDSVPQALG